MYRISNLADAEDEAALKVIPLRPPERGVNPGSTTSPQKIMDEYKLMRRLKNSHHVVRCEEARQIPHGEDEGCDILIRMELLTPLNAYLASLRPGYDPKTSTESLLQMDAAETVRLGVELCEALTDCRELHIIHRDVKPANIMVDRKGLFKLGDFGTARILEKSLAVTNTGTPLYMAPEVQFYLLTGQAYGPTVDLYSLGILLYQLLNHGRLPLAPTYLQPITEDDMQNALISRNRGKAFPPPDNAPEALAAVILKACAFNPQDRWQRAEEMGAALEQALRPAAPVVDVEQAIAEARRQWEQEQVAAEAKRQAAEATRQQEAQRQREQELAAAAETARQQALAEAQRQAEAARRQQEREQVELARQLAVEAARAKVGYKAGDIVQFGTYSQGANGEKAPIEWIVLEKRDNGLLLLSKEVLDCKNYNEKWEKVTWETCTLRQWLNREFIGAAFSREEQSRIETVQIRNPDNAKYHTKGGKDTSDRVFLLSIDEAKGYFRDDEARRAKPTAYAKKQGVWTDDNGYCWWWPRSPGSSQLDAASVLYGGGVYGRGLDVNDLSVGVRPALFANL